jgi:hypothetical protein
MWAAAAAVMLFAATGDAEILTWDCGLASNPGSVVATLDTETGVMTITGNGAMGNYTKEDYIRPPWYDVRSQITTLVIGEGVTTVGKYAFGGGGSSNSALNIASVTFPSTLKSIGEWAFGGLIDMKGGLNIPEGVTSIERYAFYSCRSLTGNLTLPSTLTSIGRNAFYNCDGFTGSLAIPEGVTSIGNQAFDRCSGFNGSLTLPSTLTSIGDRVFASCSGFTGDLVIPEGVTSIGNTAFAECKGFTGSLTLPATLIVIGGYSFLGCGFTGNLTIPEKVVKIDNGAFAGCAGFEGSLTLPVSLRFIGSSAFKDCSGLTGSLTIPETPIGDRAFENCDGLTEVINLRAIPQTISASTFTDQAWTSTRTLVVPNATALAAYKSAAVWSTFGTIVTADVVSVLTRNRAVPAIPEMEAVVIAPSVNLPAEFTAGPNPVSRDAGKVVFFRQGKRASGTLTIYDAWGNVIRKINIVDTSIGAASRREVGSWDLKDAKGRSVPEGTYLVRGTVEANDGKSEKVSLVVGVR